MPDPAMPAAPPLTGAPLPPGLGAPPQMGAAPPNLGGATRPSPNPGNAAAAVNKVRDAVKMLESALSDIPMGSPLHTKAVGVIKTILEAIPDEGPGESGPQMAGLLQLIRQQSQNAPNAALARLQASPQNAPPMMAPPQAA
jgi:hypothetical protein